MYSFNYHRPASVAEAAALLAGLKRNKRFAKATHNSWAARIGGEGIKADDGEAGAGAIILRVLAIALPVVVLSADVDPTDLGDGLAQVLHLPERFVIGTVAALRMLTLLRDDLDAMRRSRRARGIADQGKVKYWFSLAFGLLVMSLRRAGKLATAMEARGFGGPGKRTWARESKLDARDWAVMAVCLAVALAALGLAWATGDLRPVWAAR